MYTKFTTIWLLKHLLKVRLLQVQLYMPVIPATQEAAKAEESNVQD